MKSPVETIRAVCTAMAAGDLNDFLNQLDAHVHWHSAPGITKAGAYVGHAGVVTWWDEFHGNGRCSATEFGELPDGRIVAFGTLVVRRAEHAGFGAQAAWVFSLRGGLVTRLETHMNHLAVSSLRDRAQLVAA